MRIILECSVIGDGFRTTIGKVGIGFAQTGNALRIQVISPMAPGRRKAGRRFPSGRHPASRHTSSYLRQTSAKRNHRIGHLRRKASILMTLKLKSGALIQMSHSQLMFAPRLYANSIKLGVSGSMWGPRLRRTGHITSLWLERVGRRRIRIDTRDCGFVVPAVCDPLARDCKLPGLACYGLERQRVATSVRLS